MSFAGLGELVARIRADVALAKYALDEPQLREAAVRSGHFAE